MIIFLLILLLIVFSGIQLYGTDSFNTKYLDKGNTASVNGIFVILVVFSHFSQYADLAGAYDAPYLILKAHLNQLVVATFWFYSGYGMMTAICKSEGKYLNKIPYKFWKLLLKFDIAVILYWIMNTFFGKAYSAKQVLLALTAWGTVGNSNWYIFAVLIEYLLLYLSFILTKNLKSRHRRVLGLALFTVLTMGAVYVQIKLGRPAYAFNTIIIMPFGAIYAKIKEEIEGIVMKNDTIYLLALAALIGVYLVSFFHRWSYGIEGYSVWALSFITLTVFVTMKVGIGNPLLEWFGAHVFSIYILQRIPMTMLAHYGCIDRHKYISLIAVFAITMLFALLFEQGTDKLISVIEGAFKRFSQET